MAVSDKFWDGKKVLITGHTGFKGGWLTIWLHAMGANITGYSLEPQTTPNLFTEARVGEICQNVIGDIRDREHLLQTILKAKPDIIIHLAAQPLVQRSYANPVETFETNVMGTVNLFEAVRMATTMDLHIRAVLNVTTDKCYENREWVWGYREHDALGGHDPYSNSKACSELVTASYRNSFFKAAHSTTPHPVIATARAGNVIGGGDWSDNRIIPDCIRALQSGQPLEIRNPSATRPWQHVLEPLSGYLVLAQHMFEQGTSFAEAWNFGPDRESEQKVDWLVQHIGQLWGKDDFYRIDQAGNRNHEAQNLKLDSSKARTFLHWAPRWDILTALEYTVDWYQASLVQQEMKSKCLEQIQAYMAAK